MKSYQQKREVVRKFIEKLLGLRVGDYVRFQKGKKGRWHYGVIIYIKKTYDEIEYWVVERRRKIPWWEALFSGQDRIEPAERRSS